MPTTSLYSRLKKILDVLSDLDNVLWNDFAAQIRFIRHDLGYRLPDQISDLEIRTGTLIENLPKDSMITRKIRNIYLDRTLHEPGDPINPDVNPLHVVVFGDVIDGFQAMGPFTERQDAVSFMDANKSEIDVPWFIMPVISPTNFMKGFDAHGNPPPDDSSSWNHGYNSKN